MRVKRFAAAALAFLALALASAGVSHLIDRATAAFTLPGTNGPYLGDYTVNLYTVAQAINLDNQSAVSAAQTANNTTQATCTVIVNPNVQFSTVASNGAACLPPAFAGRRVWISNEGGQTLQLFGSNTPFTPGTQDTINTTAGSTVYAHPATAKALFCFAEANGAWRCTGDL